MKVILLGSTGLIGKNVLTILCQDKRITQVITPVRKIKQFFPKQLAVQYDFDENEELEMFHGASAVICTLGTTMAIAKSKENFRKVDFEYPLNFAKLAKKLDINHYILNSSMGANSHSFIFYNQVKGQIEEEVKQLNLSKVTIVRPGLLGGEREEKRPIEDLSKFILRTFEGILPLKFRISKPELVAKKICESLFSQEEVFKILEAEHFT